MIALADQLTEEQFWIKPNSSGNSFGNLILHLTGHLNYYIVVQIAKTGSVRERELEFKERQIGRKEEVLKEFTDAVEIVIATLKSQTDADWQPEDLICKRLCTNCPPKFGKAKAESPCLVRATLLKQASLFWATSTSWAMSLA